MLGLPQKTLQTIKRILTRQKSEVEKNLRQVEKDDPATTPSLAEASEPGTDSFVADAHRRAIALRQQLINLASNIKAALVRIKQGTYGRCQKCGKQIEVSRLLVMPTANLCLSCSKKITS